MLESEQQKLLQMEYILHQRVIGQEQAIGAVANAIRRARAGLADPNRPIGSFIFAGPTGVGKTEVCKALAAFLFDSEENIVRLDMSEFMEEHSVAFLIGSPPGYVGYEQGGYLTEAVRRKPYSVVLLDEIEKAHPKVYNLLLQLLDEGRLTDRQGHTVDFRNTVVIMTSNLGSQLIQELSPKATKADLKSTVFEVIAQHFRPEFLNRVDEVVVFQPLEKFQLRAIVELQIATLRHRLKDRNLNLSVTKAAMDHLAQLGYDPAFGARPLRRAIQTYLEDPLAQDLLKAKYVPGETILIDYDGASLVRSGSALPID
jgi:ATP-dependent Clp protease ATP-binding subunit ClpB